MNVLSQRVIKMLLPNQRGRPNHKLTMLGGEIQRLINGGKSPSTSVTPYSRDSTDGNRSAKAVKHESASTLSIPAASQSKKRKALAQAIEVVTNALANTDIDA